MNKTILGASHSLNSRSSCFFQPFTSGADCLNRVMVIGTAPIGFCLLSATHLAYAVNSLIQSTLYLLALEPKSASTFFVNAFTCMFNAIKELSKALVSPAINAVDFVVSAGLTLTA